MCSVQACMSAHVCVCRYVRHTPSFNHAQSRKHAKSRVIIIVGGGGPSEELSRLKHSGSFFQLECFRLNVILKSTRAKHSVLNIKHKFVADSCQGENELCLHHFQNKSLLRMESHVSWSLSCQTLFGWFSSGLVTAQRGRKSKQLRLSRASVDTNDVETSPSLSSSRLKWWGFGIPRWIHPQKTSPHESQLYSFHLKMLCFFSVTHFFTSIPASKRLTAEFWDLF